VRYLLLFITVCFLAVAAWPVEAGMMDFPLVRLQSLDKTTARTMTFDARVGSTIKYGPLYIRIQACRKAPPMEQPESAAFLQIWEVNLKTDEPQWIFSGWMFASSPALSAMDHPVYDVWVIDCIPDEQNKVQEKPEEQPEPEEEEIIEEVVDSEAEAAVQ
jgi:hypothetical protein